MSYLGSKGKHRRASSGVPLDENPILKGWLARESMVVERLLNKRYGALYPSSFVTYRKDTDESPSKIWPITKDASLTSVQANEYHLRNPGTSTLWAVASGAYEVKQMHGFAITFAGTIGGPEKLALAFETKEEADEWHMAFEDAISKAVSINLLPSLSNTSEDMASVSPRTATTIAATTAAAEHTQTHQGAQAQPSFSFDNMNMHTDASASTKSKKYRSWASVLHINGISVYVEEQDEDGEGGAVMVSAVVRAPPVDVFKSLVQIRSSQGLGIFAGARTIEVLDSTTQVVTQTWTGNGILGKLCAPREMVLSRIWRKDEDGTYIVLYQSTHHPSMRETRSLFNWKAPVRVHVQAAGFTIAPLLPEYVSTATGESQECLVTLVLKADLGGFLSSSSFPGKMALPITDYALRGMLEPVVTSIVILRDRVEQNRFVVRPLSMATDSTDNVHRGNGRGASRTAISPMSKQQTISDIGAPRSTSGNGNNNNNDGADETANDGDDFQIYRTSTMLLYRDRRPLLDRQVEAADAAGLPSLTPVQESSENDGGRLQGEIMEDESVAALLSGGDAWAIEGTCFKEYWSSPGNCGFKLRGSSYLNDKKKVLGAPPMFELVAVDLLEFEEPLSNVCKYLPSIKYSPAPFLFCVQLMVPSTPPVSVVASWAAPMPIMEEDASVLIDQFEKEQDGPCPDHVAAFFRNFTEFIKGDGPEADKIRNNRFKLIPNIAQGSWIIKQSVGTTPVILGQKLETKYFRGKNYFEIDVDIGSSSVAASITNLVCGATKSLTVDMGVLIEGQRTEHLPEQLLGTIRLDKLDLKTAAYYDESTGRILKMDSEMK